MSFYQNHLKTFQSILTDLGVTAKPIQLDKSKKYCFNIYIIDMQNGFMTGGECGVLGSDNLPVLIVSYLNDLIEQSESLNYLGYNVTLKFIFSRDYHHPHHHSFISEQHSDGFPPHCRYGTFSSMLHHCIMKWIKDNKDKDITIVFKAFHPNIESYSVLPYTPHYDSSKRQGTCCDVHKFEVKDKNPLACGGGVYFPDIMIEDAMSANPFNFDKNDILKLINEDTQPDMISENAETTLKSLSNAIPFQSVYDDDVFDYSFITGLAGDFCVRDTLINSINNREINGGNGESCLVYDLTAYVILQIGDETKDYIMNDKGEFVDKPDPDKKYQIWVTPIKNMILDYIDMSRKVCMKPPLFMTYQDSFDMIKKS
jgi:nicotinamidase-related amidase